MRNHHFNQVVVVAGATGVRLGSLKPLIEEVVRETGERVYFVDFEEELKRVTGVDDIEQIVSLFLVSRPAALKQFREALEDIVGRAVAQGADKLLLLTHITYLTRNMFVPNPVVTDVLRLAPDIVFVYVVEDYYDALRRIVGRYRERYAERKYSQKPKYTIDPLTYLTWRGLDHNILAMLSTLQHVLGVRIETLLVGVKHRRLTLYRLLRYVLTPYYERRSRFTLAYFSHPITVFRRIQALAFSKGNVVSLSSIPGVDLVEAIKSKLLESIQRLILFEPTTIDELVKVPLRLVAERYCKELVTDGEHLKKEVISPLFSNELKWPLAEDTIHTDYSNEVDVINLPSLAPGSLLSDFAEAAKLEYCGPLVKKYLESLGEAGFKLSTLIEWGGLRYVTGRMEELINAQIEMRDYSYVEQSSMLIAMPLLLLGYEGDKLFMHLYVSEGVTAEVRRAQSLAKPVLALITPLSLNYIDRVVLGGGALKEILAAFRDGIVASGERDLHNIAVYVCEHEGRGSHSAKLEECAKTVIERVKMCIESFHLLAEPSLECREVYKVLHDNIVSFLEGLTEELQTKPFGVLGKGVRWVYVKDITGFVDEIRYRVIV